LHVRAQRRSRCATSRTDPRRVCAPSLGDPLLAAHGQVRELSSPVRVEWAKNRTESRVRSRVEHVFGVMKLKIGFVKVRYRGLKKNANRLFATCALVNLFVSRRKLLHRATV
jgi:hypothetical protein